VFWPASVWRFASVRQSRGRNRFGARQVLAGQRARCGLHLLERALRHHAPAVDARAQAHVDHMVGRADHVLVVLDHEHAVADVAQMAQRADQAVVVALVQADAGLVQHIHHAGQAEPIWLARRMRCDSPPLSVSALRSRLR
jgi:hypothetical protein